MTKRFSFRAQPYFTVVHFLRFTAALFALCLGLPSAAQSQDGLFALSRQQPAPHRPGLLEILFGGNRAARPALTEPERAQRPRSSAKRRPAPVMAVRTMPTTRSLSGRDIPLITVRPPRNSFGSSEPQYASLNVDPLPRASLTPRFKPRMRVDRDDDEDEEVELENPSTIGPQAYCVRTCDGFFFPAGPAQRGNGKDAQNYYCQTACPGAEVVLYSAKAGEDIETAVGPKGQIYKKLQTAFQFRSTLSPTCTCSGGLARGLSAVPISHDFTLRQGDLVVNDKGVSLFKGASRFPYKNSDFTLARNYSRLPADVRRSVVAIEQGKAYGEPGRLASLRSSRMTPVLASATLGLTSGTLSDDGVRVLDLSKAKKVEKPAETAVAVELPAKKTKKKKR